MLKTTRDLPALAAQSLKDGERFLERHAEDIRRDEHRQKMLERARVLALRYRRPAFATGTAVLAALLALWLRRLDGVAGLPLSWAGVYQAGWTVQARVWSLVEKVVR